MANLPQRRGAGGERIIHYAYGIGAPSWSPDGIHVIAEASVHAPDGSKGTEIVITPVQHPALLASRRHDRGGIFD